MADQNPDSVSVDLSGIINLPTATENQDGLVELADAAETQAGIDNTQAVTPASAAATYIALSELTAKGDLLAATGASSPVALPVGPDGAILTACSVEGIGLAWQLPAPPEPPAIPLACITGKGVLITGTAEASPSALPPGSNGQFLVSCDSAETGLCWLTFPPTFISCSTISGKGAILTGTAPESPTALPVGGDGQVLYANSLCPTGLEWRNAQGGSTRTVCALANSGVVAVTLDNLRVCFNSTGNRTWAFATVSGTSLSISQVTTASNTALATERRIGNLNSTTFCELGGNFVCAASCATYLICMGPLNNPNAIYCFVGMTGCNYCNNFFSITRLF